MRCELRRVVNGVVVRIEHDHDEGQPPEIEELVYQEPDDESNAVMAFADFLGTINEHYGPSTNRYSPRRIYIRVGPGDKHPDWTSWADLD